MTWFEDIPPVTGTFGPVCIYKMYGRYFMRAASSLTSERVKKDPAFHKTMAYAGLLAKASRIGSVVYKALSEAIRQHALYRKITGEAMTWLKTGWTVADTLSFLFKQYTGRQLPRPPEFVLYLPENKTGKDRSFPVDNCPFERVSGGCLPYESGPPMLSTLDQLSALAMWRSTSSC